jgi:hypothetical protein
MGDERNKIVFCRLIFQEVNGKNLVCWIAIKIWLKNFFMVSGVAFKPSN